MKIAWLYGGLIYDHLHAWLHTYKGRGGLGSRGGREREGELTHSLVLVAMFGEVLESCKAMSDCHCGHSCMDGYRDNVAPHVGQPLQTSVHVFSKEASHRLRGREEGIISIHVCKFLNINFAYTIPTICKHLSQMKCSNCFSICSYVLLNYSKLPATAS